MIKLNPIMVLGLCLLFAVPVQALDSNRNYTYLYFENGYPTRFNGRRPQSWANLAARANPDLVFQTGYYSLMLDCNDIQLKGYDALAGSDYRTALDQDVTVFTPATSLLLRVTQGGVDYTCDTAVVQGSGFDHVRLIESGQYLQRIDHLGLVFKDSVGNPLVVDDNCRLEVSAWPDRVTLMLDFSPETANPITRTTIQVVSPGAVTHLEDVMSNQARLTLKPQDDVKLGTLNVNDYIQEATRVQNGSALTVNFDPDVHAFNISVPADSVSYPAATNRVDEYVIEVTNPTALAENIPLVFEQPTVRAITGTTMLLCDADSGRPLGIPVQISKNWHGDGSPHSGPWLRGSTMLTLAPGQSRRFKLRVIYGYWGGAGAVSHAQLSLIGWGGNWKWDESALGSWGESITYDVAQHIAGSFMGDIRPTFTTSYTASPTYSWTENVGGGDFLIYHDSANTYHWVKRLKTCYYQTGPNLTEIFYGGVTDDDKIRVTYASRAVSTLDYHRRFHDYKYEFLQDVVSPQRLVFHQMAADWYLTAVYSNYYIGDETGLLSAETIEAGGNVYKGAPIAFDNKWLSIDDTAGNSGGNTAYALRGIIPLSSTLNGSPLPLYIHKYGRTWGASTMLFDLTGSSVTDSYSAGDVVEGEIEFIMPPQHVINYWGGDAELISRLTAYGDATWEPVRDEFIHNSQMDVDVHQGTLLNSYPLEIQLTNSHILADFTVSSGGIGHVPLVLKGAGAGLELKAQRLLGGVWTDLETVDIGNNTYYQAVQNADGTMDYTFSIPRPSLNLNEAWRTRIIVMQPVEWIRQDSFESGFDGWINRSDDDFDWSRRTGGTPSGGTGPAGASDGDYYIYTEASGANNPNKTAVISNRVDVSSYASVKMMFDYHMYGDGGMGSLHLDVFDGVMWHHDVWAVTGAQHAADTDPWTTAAVDLGPYASGGIIDVQFRGRTGAGFRSDMAVDNIRIGRLSVPYQKWASDFALAFPDAVSSANPDEDVLNNLYEYALGGDPTNSADIGHVPVFGLREDSGTNWFEFVHARRIGSGGELSYYLETSSNLLSNDWTNSGYMQLPATGTLDAGFEAVTNRIDTAGKTNAFIRLRIESL